MRPGERIGPYVVRRPLGRGAMGVVLHVAHEETGAEYAMKLVASEVLGDADARARFEREMQSMAKVDDHPGIVRIHSAGTTPDGRPYYLMDLVQGRSLKQALSSGLGLEAALDLLAQVGRALAHAHDRGLVHRDVKPENVLVSDDGVARLTDFGLARAARTADRLTRTGDLVGTPTHMAPEQAVPTLGDPGPWTDVYSLGVVLYEVLTGGQTPYTGATVVEVYTQLFEGHAYPRPGAVAPDVDPALEAVCLKALARNPADRHPTARAFVDDLDRARSSATRAQARWRRVVLALSVAAAGALLLVLLAVPYARARREEAARREAAAKLEASLAEVEALVARQAYTEALAVGAPLRASLVATPDAPEGARLDAALRAARRALLAEAWREGRLQDARELVAALPPTADDPPEAALQATLALALAGDPAGSLARASALPAPARARLAAWAGDRAACEAALAQVEPPERGRALRWELRASLPDLPPPETDGAGGEAARPAGAGANAERAGWAAVARGEAALAQGQTTLAVLHLGEVTSAEPELEVALAVGLARALLARGDVHGAAVAVERALRAAAPPLERARALGWAAWVYAALTDAGGERGSLDSLAAPLSGPARRGVLSAARSLGPSAPEAAAAVATLEAPAGRAPPAAAFARHFPSGAAARAAGVQAERDLGARGGDGPAGLLLARAFDLATLADQARDPELGRRAGELAAIARRLRPGSPAACVAAARAARARTADPRLADGASGPSAVAVAAARAAAAAATQAARDAAALGAAVCPADRLPDLEVARGLAAEAAADGLALDLARLAGEPDPRAEGELAARLTEAALAFAAARAAGGTPGDDVDDEARLGQGRALVARARRRVAASSDEEGGDPVVRAQVGRALGQALDEALGPLLSRVDVAAVATARAALVAAVEADAAALDGAAASGVLEAEVLLAGAAGPRPSRQVLEALLLRATGADGRTALDAYLALAGDVPVRALITAQGAETAADLTPRAQRLDPGLPNLAIDRALDGAAVVAPEAFEGLARALGDDPQWTLVALDALSQATRGAEGGAGLHEALSLEGATPDDPPVRLVARALLWRSRPPFSGTEAARSEEAAEHDRGARLATALVTRALAADPSNGAAWLLRALCASSLARGSGVDKDADPLVAPDLQDDLLAARAAAPWGTAPLLAALRVGPFEAAQDRAADLLAAGHFGVGHAERLLMLSTQRRAKVEPLVKNFLGKTFSLGEADDTYRQAQLFDRALPRLALTMRLQAATDHEDSRDPYEGQDGVPALLPALGLDAATAAATASATWSAHRARRRAGEWSDEARTAATLALAGAPPGLDPADLLAVAWRPGASSPELPGLPPLWRAWSGLRRPSTALEVLARQRPRASRGPLFEDVLDVDGRTWALLVGVQAGRGWQGEWLVDRHAFAEAALAFDRSCALRCDAPLAEGYYWQLLWGLRWEAGRSRKTPADAEALRRHALAAVRRAATTLQSPTLRALEADLLLDAAHLVAPARDRAALAARARAIAEGVALDDISENLESGATAAWRLVRHRAAAGDREAAREAVKLVRKAEEEDDDWWLGEYIEREPLRDLLRAVPEVAELLDEHAPHD